ncbi:pentatricopeptide repeat-containing protein [Cinnamomum micranthum f. kanehirae]|uniref:Pentatricopeptide repeat-containing protein n=1 Tax=Cinnamomum micranthum f. kanehirae TaxID=337451 RepID=A0A3S3NVZ4_9MAGN|nr:pentatricopeptide repeat-containing protein [Cinnamomum micranthum f. kanehirae]
MVLEDELYLLFNSGIAPHWRRLRPDDMIANNLINMYAKTSGSDCMQRVFDEMKELGLVSWNSMISSYAQIGCGGIFLSECSPSTLGVMFWVNKFMFIDMNGYDLASCNAMIDGYCGDTGDACVVIGDISEPDEVAWTTMISGCMENGDDEYALLLYH